MNIVTIGDISKQIRGVTYKKSDVSGEPLPGFVPVLRAGNIVDGEIDLADLVYVPKNKISSRQFLRQGDILIAASSGSLSVVGKAARVRQDYEAGFGAFCKVLRPNKKVSPAYFANYFQTQSYRHTVSNLAAGANINNLRNEHLDNLVIPLPPLDEQQRIAAILDKADGLRAKRRAALAKLDTLLQATFLDMFGDPDESPSHGERIKLGDIVLVQGGYAFKSKDYISAGVKLVKIANVHAHHLTWNDIDRLPEHYLEEYSDYVLRSGDIVMSLTRPIIKSLKSAKVAEVREEDLPCLLNQRVGRLVIKEPTLCDRDFVLQFCYTPYFRNQIDKLSSTSLQPNVSTKQVEKIELNLPNIELQKHFSIVTQKMQDSRKCMLQSIDNLDNLFHSLQQRAFQGEL